jgi:sulfate transport system substrate-binding protein
MIKKIILALMLALPISTNAASKKIEILNVSYDPTREFYKEYNKSFEKHWKDLNGEDVKITASNGGSGKQARSVIDGLKADVVTLALAYDIDAIAKRGLIDTKWQSRLENNSSPYTSTIVFLVRKGNPKNIKDWSDLIRPGVKVITPNPKTSGGARWGYLAAYGYALEANNKDEAKATDFVRQLFNNVPVLDTGARGATTTFTNRQIGDVLVTWENEAFLAIKELGKEKFEIVMPSLSIKAEPPVAVVDKVVDQKGTRKIAEEYLKFLYSNEAQEIAAKNYYRPSNKDVAKKYAAQFPQIKMLGINDFGGWEAAQKKHFDDNGIFDKIYSKK